MRRTSSRDPGSSSGLVVEIVDTLEACGLDPDGFQLQQFVDVDALGRLLASSTGEMKVLVTVEGIRLAVTPSSVEVLDDERDGSKDH